MLQEYRQSLRRVDEPIEEEKRELEYNDRDFDSSDDEEERKDDGQQPPPPKDSSSSGLQDFQDRPPVIRPGDVENASVVNHDRLRLLPRGKPNQV